MTSYPRAFVAPSWGLGFEEPARWTSRSTASIPTFPIPSKAAGALPDGWCALPATVVFGVLGFFIIYFGAPFVFLSGPGTVTAPRHVVSLPYTRAGHPDEAGARRHGQSRRRDRRGDFTGAGQHRRDLYARAGGHRRPHGGTAHQGSRRAGPSRSGALLSARDPGSSRTPRRDDGGHRNLPHGSFARIRLGPQSRCLRRGGSLRVHCSTRLA